MNSNVNEINTSVSAWQTYRESFLGSRKYYLHFGSVNSGYLRSNEISTPWLPNDVTVQLTELNIGGLGDVAIDYKYAVLTETGGLYVECTTSGAYGSDTLQNQTVTCVITMTKK